MSHGFVGQELRTVERFESWGLESSEGSRDGCWPRPQPGLWAGTPTPCLSMQSGIPYNMVPGFQRQGSEPAVLRPNFFLTQPWKSHSITSAESPMVGAVTRPCPDSRRGRTDPTSWWAEHQSHCEKNMWDGINMLLQPSLERKIHHIWSVCSKASVHGTSHTAVYPPRPITQALLAVCCLSVSFWVFGCFWMLQGQQ